LSTARSFSILSVCLPATGMAAVMSVPGAAPPHDASVQARVERSEARVAEGVRANRIRALRLRSRMAVAGWSRAGSA